MRRSKSLGEFVPEIERFLHKRKRVARNNTAMAERTLKEYATPSTEEPQAIIVYPTVEGNNFEIKPALLNLVQQNQFSGSPAEDPNLHISTFLRLSGTLKANQEAIEEVFKNTIQPPLPSCCFSHLHSKHSVLCSKQDLYQNLVEQNSI